MVRSAEELARLSGVPVEMIRSGDEAALEMMTSSYDDEKTEE